MSATAFAPLVLFDLDGTLVDSAVDLLNALNQIVRDAGRPPMTLTQIRPVVSKGARAMLRVAFPELDDAGREAFLQPFLAEYAEAVAVHSTAFDGIEEVLHAIETSGSRWGIVTNKPFYLAEGVVATMGWAERCAILIGADTLPKKKPEPDQLFYACEQLGVVPASCVYVGDDERDIVAARAAGMKSVAALWGYREAHENPADWRPDASVEHPRDMLQSGLLAR